MLVDDEPELRFLVKRMLKREGYEVIEAANGEESLEMLKTIKPGLILMDVRMPGLDGWEVCKRIKENPKTKNIPVIIFSVRDSEESLKRSFEYAHADAHIGKPFEIREFIDKIKIIFEKSSSQGK
jgi:DNA-binding response OmpR family regulator